ncbi:auxin-responsive protein IAA17-like [Primulina tabacum]|uniref:auxin-responsive protein IAA17-like n=1 Tax=Primulina tabacum TaxID=48773 RepID=UPI003F5A6832
MDESKQLFGVHVSEYKWSFQTTSITSPPPCSYKMWLDHLSFKSITKAPSIFRRQNGRMSLEIAAGSPGTEYAGGLKTELTLGLPGARPAQEPKPGEKRGFSETVDLNVGSNFEDEGVVTPKLPPAKSQVVGWPPLRSNRRSMMKNCKYVKVAVDGAPYLRKVDLEVYGSYQELLAALEDLFTCLTKCLLNHVRS